MAYGMGMGRGGGGMRKTEQMDANYNFPVIALKALTDYQPKDYQFNLDGRALFDISKLPKMLRSSTATSAKKLLNLRQRPLSINSNHKKHTRSII